MQDPVSLAVADRAQHDRLGADRAGHQESRHGAILNEVMSKTITLYTTDKCSSCLRAKALLTQRALPFEEINLSRDPDGRAALVQRTGMMTFPQVLVGERRSAASRRSPRPTATVASPRCSRPDPPLAPRFARRLA